MRIPHHTLHAGGKAAAEAAACGLCGRGLAAYGRGRHAYCKRCMAKTDREIARTLRTGCRACGKALATTNRIVRSAQRSAAAQVRAWYAAHKGTRRESGAGGGARSARCGGASCRNGAVKTSVLYA